MASIYESELESELEQELQGLHEGEFETENESESEAFLGGLGDVLGGLLGESEFESESEFETEFESEFELEGEFEGEQFFGSIFKGIGRFVKNNAGLLKKVAKLALPAVATAIGGPVGPLLGKLASSALGESEFESELELEFEFESESESEFETETESESEIARGIVSQPVTEHEALAELMAEAASHAQQESEAEAMAGAATFSAISPRDRRALRRILPHMTRGVAILARILARRRETRPALRTLPTIIKRTVTQVKKHAAAGRPVTRKLVGRIAARQVGKVLGSPKICTAAMVRNVRSSRAMKRSRRPLKRAAVRG